MSPIRRRVLYIDGHRSPAEFRSSYTDPNSGSSFSFDENFVHVSFLRDDLYPDSWSSSFELRFIEQTNRLVEIHNPKIVIIDSADWLLSLGCSLKDLNRFMLTVRDWIRLHGISVLLLISPVERTSKWNNSRQLRLFYNQVPSIFSLCRSRCGSDLFYIRDEISGSGDASVNRKVLLASAAYANACWTFTLKNYEYEFHHSLSRPENLPLILREMAAELREKGYSIREIGTQLGISKSSVQRILSPLYLSNSEVEIKEA